MLVCLLLIGNLFKTCIISVDLGKALVMLVPVQQIRSIPSCQIDRGHIKVPQNVLIHIGNKKI